MGRERNYVIYSLNAREIMKLCEKRGRRFDLNSQYDREQILLNETRFAECALFYQIKRAAQDQGDERSAKEIITKSLVYLDFGNGVAGLEKETQELLSKGFELKFKKDIEFTKFVPFDKSASMSRNNTLSFIDETLFSDVDEALDIGIDKSLIELIPSKYYAYRGLYMTDGTDIDPSRLKLNEKTVIVLKNESFMLKNQYAIGIKSEKNEDGMIDICDENKDVLDVFKVTPYDGEGLISPEYAKIINSELINKRGTAATSFQIRMPFGKGMLHKVDFIKFIKDQFPEDFSESLEVTDFFGIKRKLKDVQIILTDSMLKCAKWLERLHAEGYYDCDPMKYYFDNFSKYEHALYVASTDRNIRSDKRVKMTYQFLNTLKLNESELEHLVNRHIDETEHILSDPYLGREALLVMDDKDDTDPDADQAVRMEPWEYALINNVSFVNDPMIKGRLKQATKSRIKEMLKGRLMVNGTVKYLSGDLLDLLVYLAEKCNVSDKEKLKHFRAISLMPDRFYISDMSRYGLTMEEYYGVLRSPHLSRNELCALRPYASTIYNKYFSELKGVIMVSNRSYAPAAMSGADFDGDMVKIVTDDIINSALLKAAYDPDTEKGPDSTGVIPYKRKVPVPVISSPWNKKCFLGSHISFEDLKASFSNRVGIISNLAITMGKLEYCDHPKVPADSTALCTIATGLEIDSVKTGVKPDISKLKELCKDEDDKYIKIVNSIKAIEDDSTKRNKAIHTRIDTDTGEYTAFQKNKKKEEVLFVIDDKQNYIVDYLPYYYAKALAERRATGRVKMDAGIEVPEYRFEFEKSEDWRIKALKDPRIPELRKIIGAFRKLNVDTLNISRAEAQAKEGSLRGKVVTILDIEYDRETDVLYLSKEYIDEAIETAYQEVYSVIQSEKEAKKALELIEDLNWQYIRTFEEKHECLKDIIGTDELSISTLEILCDTYDNGYQILNYIIRDVSNSRKAEALQIAADNADTDEDVELPVESIWTREYSKSVFARIFREYRKYYTRTDYNKTDWIRDAAKICRKEVLKLFDNDVDLAIECCVALDGEIDEKHGFLWRVFQTEDFKDVIYRKKREGDQLNA